MEGKSSTQNAEIEQFSSICQLMILSDVSEIVPCSDCENFSLRGYSKFAVERD